MTNKFLYLAATLIFSFNSFAAWQVLDDFSSPALSLKKWKITQKGSGKVDFIKLGNRSVLKLSLPAGKHKRANAQLLKVPAIPRNNKLIITFDMKLDWSGTVQGYKNSLWYGTGNEYVIMGQNAICNWSKSRKKFYLNGKLSKVRGENKWYHYRLILQQNQQILKIYPNENSVVPIVTLKSKKHLPGYGNMLCINMGSMFSSDSFTSARGKMYIDNLKYKTEHNKVPSLAITKGDFTLTFNKKNGVLDDLKYKNENLVASYDRYKLQLRNKSILSMAADNKVLKYRRTADGIIFNLSNPELPGIEIIQEYKILSDQISKKVTFNSSKDVDGFLTYFCGGELTRKFRKNSVYQTLRGWDVKTIYDAEDITNIISVGHPQAHWGSKVVTISRADKNLVLAHFGWKRNDKYTWLITQMAKESTKYTPSGWFFPAMIFHPEADKSNSFESIYQVINGTHLDFYNSYRNRNEFKKITTKKIPGWLRDTKLEIVSWYTSIDGYSTNLQKLLDASRYSPEENGIMTIWGWAKWGEFPNKDNDKVSIGKRRKRTYTTAKDFSRLIASAKEKNSSVKVGLYQLLWSLPPAMAKKHPEWIPYHSNGQATKMRTEPGWTPYYRLLSNPASKKSILDGLVNIWNYYPIDYMYIDGGVRGQVYPDWKTMQCDSANKWMRLWKQIFTLAKAQGDDFALHYNNPFPIYSHAGLSENGSFGRWYKEDWRCITDVFTIVKTFQTPGRLLSVLYRSTGHRSNEPQYTNMILASGLTPAGAKDTGICPNFANLAAYLGYINAAFELRDTVLKNAVIFPLYFLRKAQVQANVLKLRNTFLISILRHKGSPNEQIKLKIDNAKAGLISGQKYSLYQIDVKPAKIEADIKIRGKASDLKLEQIVRTSYLGDIKLSGKAFSYQLKLPNNRLRFLVLSKSKARIVKVNGRKTQFQLPALLKATVASKEFSNRMEIKVNSPYDNITVRVILPAAFAKSKVSLTPANLPYKRIGNELEITISKNIKKVIIK